MKFKDWDSYGRRENHIEVAMWFREDRYHTARSSHTRIERKKRATTWDGLTGLRQKWTNFWSPPIHSYVWWGRTLGRRVFPLH